MSMEIILTVDFLKNGYLLQIPFFRGLTADSSTASQTTSTLMYDCSLTEAVKVFFPLENQI